MHQLFSWEGVIVTQGIPWTDEEIAVLVRQHRTSTAEEIGSLIGRTPVAVRTKARVLGISTRLDPNHPHYARLSAQGVGAVNWYLQSPAGELERRSFGMRVGDAPAVPYPCTAQEVGL